jgi:NOL1/NOP2/fmu family ribosome biogenesis protein
LADIWPVLKENGIMIYSTCTFNPCENEENIQWLMELAGIEPVKIEINKNWGITTTETSGFPGYRFYPHKVKGEGFFMAVVRKIGTEKQNYSKKSKENQLFASKSDKEIAAKFVDRNNIELIRFEDAMLAFPSELLSDLNLVKNNLRIVHAGVKVGEFKQKELLPAHELALSPIINRNYFPEVSLSIEQVLTYLKRDEIRPESEEKGWNLLSYRNIPLGWAKNLGNRFNSAYPKEWRIRMNISGYQGENLQKELSKFPLG